MSNRPPISWAVALRDLRDDRAVVARPQLAWSYDPATNEHTCRHPEFGATGRIYAASMRLHAVVSVVGRTEVHTDHLRTTWPMSPVGLREAKVAFEAALADALASPDAALIAAAHARGRAVAADLHGAR